MKRFLAVPRPKLQALVYDIHPSFEGRCRKAMLGVKRQALVYDRKAMLGVRLPALVYDRKAMLGVRLPALVYDRKAMLGVLFRVWPQPRVETVISLQ